MTKAIICIATLAIMLVTAGCKSAKKPAVDAEVATAEESAFCVMPPRPGASANQAYYMPMAKIYKTTGNFNNNVPITLNADHTAVVSYPAPSDINAYSAPVQLSNGYLLDRRGITPQTVFTRYTYDQYQQLPQAPSPAELLKAVIPGSGVTEIVKLPFTLSDVESNLGAVDKLIVDGLPGCTTVYETPKLKL